MRLGIDIPLVDGAGRLYGAKEVMSFAAMVEAAGLDGIWVGDGSYFSQRAGTAPDPLMRLLLAAAATERVEVGTAIYQVPLREPVDLAQRLMTLAGLTGDRFTAGIGPGSQEHGFNTVGLDYEDRFKLLYSKIDKVRRLLGGETVGPAAIPPWAETEGGPHFVLAAAWGSRLSITRAAKEFDGWMASTRRNLAVMREGIEQYRDLGGTRAMATTCFVNLRGPDTKLAEDEPFNLVCSPAQAAERLHLLSEIGFDDLCCFHVESPTDGPPGPPSLGHGYSLDELEEIRSVLPKDGRKPYEG